MIHRSSIGSFERFIGLLLEHFSGNLPLWLAPVQVSVLPIGKNHLKYAKKFLTLWRKTASAPNCEAKTKASAKNPGR